MSQKILTVNEAEELYQKGSYYAVQENYRMAAKTFKKVIRVKGTYFETGAYVNLAQAIFLPDPQNELLQSKALGYIEKALEIKPTNQVALSTGILISLFKKDYEVCLSYFSQIEDLESLKNNPYNLQDWVYNSLHSLSLEDSKFLSKQVHLVETIYKRDKKIIPEVGHILIRTYASLQEFKKAYSIMDELETLHRSHPEVYLDHFINFSIESTFLHKQPLEGVTYAKQGIEMYNKQGLKFKKRHADKFEKLESNLSSALLMSGQYNETIQLLTPKVKMKPNNGDYHNLAYAYYKIGNYEDGLKCTNNALFISQDELTWYLKSEIYYAKKQYKESLKYLLRAAYYVETLETSITSKDKELIRSINLDKPTTKKEIYTSLVNCYIALRQFSTAKTIITKLKEEWPFENQFKQLERHIDLFSDYDISDQETQKILHSLQKEINEQSVKHQNEIHKVRKWAVELLKLQNQISVDESNSLIEENDWSDFSAQMHKISLLMKSENKKELINYKEIKRGFKQSYPNMSNKGLEFLSTGEYLYKIHYHSEIDFAPVMVEFSKVIEVELNLLLKRKDWPNRKEFTLGQIKYQLEKEKKSNDESMLEFLRVLITYRNGSAHTGYSTREKVQEVKSLILDQGWLKSILDSE